MRSLLRPISLPYEVLQAVDGSALSWDEAASHLAPKAVHEARWAEEKGVPTICMRTGSFSPHFTLAAVGCALSHRAAWQRLASAPKEVDWCLILEDDVSRFAECFESKLETLLATLPSSWRMCYLGYHESSGTLLPNAQRLRISEVGPDEGQTGLYGYLLRRVGALELLRERAVFPLRYQIDVALGTLHWPCSSRFVLSPEATLIDSPRSEDGACDTDVQTLGAGDKKAHGSSVSGAGMLLL